MSTRPLSAALALLAALPLTACSSTYQVRLAEAAAIRSGANVVLADGDTLEIRETFAVRAAPFPGAVLVPARPDDSLWRAEPAFDVKGGLGELGTPWMKGPVRLRVAGPYLQLQDARHRIFVDASSVQYLQLEQPNPGKTAAIVLGVGIPGTLVGLVQVALLVTVLSGGFNVPVR